VGGAHDRAQYLRLASAAMTSMHLQGGEVKRTRELDAAFSARTRGDAARDPA
jgi:hypothetical protein